MIITARRVGIGPIILLTIFNRAALRLASSVPWDPARPRKICVACGHPVHDGNAFLRYHGDYYHADPCLGRDLPAQRRAALAAEREAVNLLGRRGR